MKYMLMMNCPRDGYEQFGSWPRRTTGRPFNMPIEVREVMSGPPEELL